MLNQVSAISLSIEEFVSAARISDGFDNWRSPFD